VCTEACNNDATQVCAPLHVEEVDVFADAGFQDVNKHQETQGTNANRHVVTRPSKRKALDKSMPMGEVMDKPEQVKKCVRVKTEHSFRVIERQFGHTKVRFAMLFLFNNQWLVRKRFLNMEQGEAPAPRDKLCGAWKTATKGRNPLSQAIRIQLPSRHSESLNSVHATSGERTFSEEDVRKSVQVPSE
jgi:hypothetical protein